MSEHMFWTCRQCGNQYTIKDVRDAHVAEIHGDANPCGVPEADKEA